MDRLALLRRGLIGAIEHVLAEGATWVPEGGDAEDPIRVTRIQLGARCVECGGVVVRRGSLTAPPSLTVALGRESCHADAYNRPRTNLDLDHEPVADDEDTGVVFYVTDRLVGTRRRLTGEGETWATLGLAGLCRILDRLAPPPGDWDMARYLAFGPTEEPC